MGKPIPSWPRGLSSPLAAAYVGEGETTFRASVKKGKWPPPRKIGAKDGKDIWDRHLLDQTYDEISGLDPAPRRIDIKERLKKCG